jgi:hypothetical protein
MGLIAAIAGLGALAIKVYNSWQRRDPERVAAVTSGFKQTTSVLSALIAAVVAIMDALAGISRMVLTAQSQAPRSGGSTTWGRPASEVAAEA